MCCLTRKLNCILKREKRTEWTWARLDRYSVRQLLQLPHSPVYLYSGWTRASIREIVNCIAIVSNYSDLCMYGSFQLCKLSLEFALFVVLFKNLNSCFLCV